MFAAIAVAANLFSTVIILTAFGTAPMRNSFSHYPFSFHGWEIYSRIDFKNKKTDLSVGFMAIFSLELSLSMSCRRNRPMASKIEPEIEIVA